jgi:hypothetical protein
VRRELSLVAKKKLYNCITRNITAYTFSTLPPVAFPEFHSLQISVHLRAENNLCRTCSNNSRIRVTSGTAVFILHLPLVPQYFIN